MNEGVSGGGGGGGEGRNGGWNGMITNDDWGGKKQTRMEKGK